MRGGIKGSNKKREGRPRCFNLVLVLSAQLENKLFQEGLEDNGADALGNLKPRIQWCSAKILQTICAQNPKQIKEHSC